MKTSIKIIHWAPRIICILAILFVGIFALDSFDPRYTLWQQLEAFFIHLIPNFILIIFLIVAWKWELAGGLILVAFALILSPPVFFINYRMNHSVWMSLSVILMINFPFVITGALFVLSHFMKKKDRLQSLQTQHP
jgi:hypothetical protein